MRYSSIKETFSLSSMWNLMIPNLDHDRNWQGFLQVLLFVYFSRSLSLYYASRSSLLKFSLISPSFTWFGNSKVISIFFLPVTFYWVIQISRDDCRSVSLDDASESDTRDLVNELETMKQLKPHPHVIKLLGCVTETGELFPLAVQCEMYILQRK